MNDFFKFEEKDLDFPFYNGHPLLSTKDWSILVLGAIVYVAIVFGVFNFIPGFEDLPSMAMALIHFLVLFLPVLYCCRGKIGLIFKKPKLKDLKVIVLCIVLYFIFSIVIRALMSLIFGMPGASAATGASASGEVALQIISMLIGLMAEELVKVISLIVFMALIFKFTADRKNSMIVGIILCCIFFGLIHLNAYDFNVVYCLLGVGLGCIIHLYPYLKTKNIVNSYLTHIAIDLFGVVVPILMSMMH